MMIELQNVLVSNKQKKYTDDEIKEFFRNCWYS